MIPPITQATQNSGDVDVLRMIDKINTDMAEAKEYVMVGSGHSAKLFPRWDGLYRVVKSFPLMSTY